MVRVNSLWRQVLQEGPTGKVSTLDLKGAVDQNLSAMAFRGPVNFYGNLFTTNPTLREVNAVRSKAGWWTDKEINFQCTLMLATDKVVYLYVWNKPPRENIMPVERGPVLVPHGPRCYHDEAPFAYPATAGLGNTFYWSIQNPPTPGPDGWWYVVGQPGDTPFMKWTTPCLNIGPDTGQSQAILNEAGLATWNFQSTSEPTFFYSNTGWELQNATVYDGQCYFDSTFTGDFGQVLIGKNMGTAPITFWGYLINVYDQKQVLAEGNHVTVNPGEIGVSTTGLVPWQQASGAMAPAPGCWVEVSRLSAFEYIEMQPGSYFKALHV